MTQAPVRSREPACHAALTVARSRSGWSGPLAPTPDRWFPYGIFYQPKQAGGVLVVRVPHSRRHHPDALDPEDAPKAILGAEGEHRAQLRTGAEALRSDREDG